MSAECVRHHIIPLPTSVSFEAVVGNLKAPDNGRWWLDSNGQHSTRSQFSFAGNCPYAWLETRGTRHELRVMREVRQGLDLGETCFHGDPIDVLRRLLPNVNLIGLDALPFVGGAVGVFGYELAEAWDSTGLVRTTSDDYPDQIFAFVDRLIVEDHCSGRRMAIGLGFGAEEALAQERAKNAATDIAVLAMDAHDLTPNSSDPELTALASLTPSLNEGQYESAVEEIGRAIAQGDVYQVCLTQSLRTDFHGDPFQLYLKIRRANPAPFSSYFELPHVTVMSTSPERFLKVDASGNASSSPIKGTRRRSVDRNGHLHEASKLSHSEKDRAENLMIVDLVRNDLGRVCEPGSIDVPSLCCVEEYEEIFHLVSTVTGKLRADCDALEAVRATLPPGSMTGAPKLAAVKIARRLEVGRRGYYAGALGYLDLRGRLDLAVVIRTLFLEECQIKLHSGGGVVADSTPAGEWRELWDKLVAIRRGLGE